MTIFLKQRAKETGISFRPFEIERDYPPYVDGKPRYEGVKSFLASRNIYLPDEQEASSSAEMAGEITVQKLGDRKDRYFEEILDAEGIEAYRGAVALVQHLRSQGVKTAVVSSSRNCKKVLKAASITSLFDYIMDGSLAEQLHLAGKPEPDTFLKAAEQLGASADRSVVVEDAIAGVQAGRKGNFGLVIGVIHGENATSLKENGADIVVRDLSELLPQD